MDIDIYWDPEVRNLKEQIVYLEIEISLLATQKADIEKQLHYFQSEYNKHLGDLIEAILLKRKESLKKDAATNPKIQAEYQKAENEYAEFKNTVEESKNFFQATLNEDEQIALKTSFKKACKLCHPDKVADEYKTQAQEIFIRLKQAYDSNDLLTVLDILNQLEKGLLKMGSESITEKNKLLAHFQNLKNNLDRLRTEINTLLNSDAYRISSALADYDKYFEELHVQLTKELNNW